MSKGWTIFFWAAATYNLVIGTLGFLDPAGTIDNKAIALLVLSFGVVYFQVARQPLRLAPVLWAGVFGKFGIVALLGPGALGAAAHPTLAPILVGDFLFGCGFLAFLLGPAKRNASTGESQ
jgi:hypothetical protein